MGHPPELRVLCNVWMERERERERSERESLLTMDGIMKLRMHVFTIQGRSQKFVSEGDKTGTGDRSPPAGSRGRTLVGLGASPQKLKTYMLITIAIMC